MADELTLDQLHGVVSDPESEKKVAQSLQLPLGNYNSAPELIASRYRGKPESRNPGREMVKFYGSFSNPHPIEVLDPATKEVLYTVPAGEAKGRASFWVSWEARFNPLDHPKHPGEADNMSQRWTELKKVYLLAMGLKEEPLVSPILEYAVKYSIGVRFGPGNEENQAYRIFSARD